MKAQFSSSSPARVSSKTQDISVLILQKLTAAPRVVISDVLNVSTAFAAGLYIRLGRTTSSAFTASVNIRIEASPASSGNTHWHQLQPQFVSALGSSVAAQALTVASLVGDKTLSMAATTNFAVGDIVYIDDTVDITKSEFGRVASVASGSSITLEEGLTYAHAVTTTTVYDQAEIYYAQIDCQDKGRIRIVIDGSGAAQNFAVDAMAITEDSIV